MDKREAKVPEVQDGGFSVVWAADGGGLTYSGEVEVWRKGNGSGVELYAKSAALRDLTRNRE